MTFTRVKAGGWDVGERLTEAQMDALDVNMTKAVDGDAGGTYTPSAALSITDLECPTAPASGDDVTNKTYVDAAATTTYCHVRIAGSGLAVDAKFTLTINDENGGFTVDGTDIVIPTTGTYELSFCLPVTSSSVASNTVVGTYAKLDAAFIVHVYGPTRYSTTTTDKIPIVCPPKIFAATAGQKISMAPTDSGTTTVSGAVATRDCYMLIRKLPIIP